MRVREKGLKQGTAKKEGAKDGRDPCIVLPTDYTISSYFATL